MRKERPIAGMLLHQPSKLFPEVCEWQSIHHHCNEIEINIKLTCTRALIVVWSIAITGDIITQSNPRLKFRAQNVTFVEEEHYIRLLQERI